MKTEVKKEGIEWLKAFAIGIIIFAFIRTFFISNYVVEGESMLPTLKEGNKLVVSKFGYETSDLKHFDIIVFHASKREDFVKRVIGLPGDKIEYRDDRLFINGTHKEEPFLDIYKEETLGGTLTGDFTLEELTGYEKVPEGKLFVLGDNRLGSWDSRHFGFISEDQVVGAVNLKYWPLDEIHLSYN
ncbi:signal peptidase I [Mesobacillus harenae]|uniref:signal peptidase I n=1 Tax=Mesobacillus harenae TaxID=2213203 RepID=UPI001580267C|nr:signal peptidase I [Mesobacillus harenae]